LHFVLPQIAVVQGLADATNCHRRPTGHLIGQSRPLKCPYSKPREGGKHGKREQVQANGFHIEFLAICKAWNISRWLVRAQVTNAARMSACALA
jgi:hypothetical protein